MLKIRRSRDRLVFNMGILYLEKTVFILRRGPVSLITKDVCQMLWSLLKMLPNELLFTEHAEIWLFQISASQQT